MPKPVQIIKQIPLKDYRPHNNLNNDGPALALDSAGLQQDERDGLGVLVDSRDCWALCQRRTLYSDGGGMFRIGKQTLAFTGFSGQNKFTVTELPAGNEKLLIIVYNNLF
ncbi:MAG: hypothetical protein PHO08_20545 [Methylococcales bacterium]|nr:hypothetical protein [Methylococcales bacterium]